MVSVYENLTVIKYDKARHSTKQGGYKYLIRSKGFQSYTAYRTDKGFNDWILRTGLTLEHVNTNTFTVDGEEVTAKMYNATGRIEEHSFWSMDEVPELAKRFTGLSNGSLVDCFYLRTDKGAKIYRPNPNAKDVYKPLPIEDHIEFQRING